MGDDPNFPITAAQLAGNFCEALFYGMYLVSCVFCARALLMTGREERWRRASEIRWMMVFVAVSLFWINTFDVANGLYHNIQAFVQSPDAADNLIDISNWVNIARSVDQVVAMILGDFVLIYRCYVVYGRRWLIVIPSLILYLGGVAMAIKLIYVEASLNHAEITLNSGAIQPWWRAFFAITAVQNGMTTGLLIWRIWRVERQLDSFRSTRHASQGRSGQPKLRKVIRVIGESGAAYTTCVVITFIVSVCNSNALYPTSDATLQATGIAFNVIIARSTSSREEEFTKFDNQERTMAEQGGNSTGYTMNSLNFNNPKKSEGTENIVSFKSTISDDTAVGDRKEIYTPTRSAGPIVNVQTDRWTTTV